MQNLSIWVVNSDDQKAPHLDLDETPILGQAIVEVANDMARTTTGGLAYKVASPADSDNDPRALKQAVYDEYVSGSHCVLQRCHPSVECYEKWGFLLQTKRSRPDCRGQCVIKQYMIVTSTQH